MFGYIRPLQCELKVKELELYKAFYCGLCHTLSSHYGILSRAVLQYDCTFVAIVGASLAEDAFRPPQGMRCPFKPLTKKKAAIPSCDALGYAAALNILFAYSKLDDDVRDEHSVTSRAAKGALHAAYRKACAQYPLASMLIEDALLRLHDLEENRCDDPDRAADVFGTLLGDLFTLCPGADDAQKKALAAMGYALGRWVYLIDAWDDRRKDQKHGAYNVFLLCECDEKRASFLLHASLCGAFDAFTRMQTHHCRHLIENILTLGCASTAERMLHSEDHDGPVQDS